MKIRITDRESIESGLLVRSTYAVISIRDPGSRKAKIPATSGLKDILYLAFHDAEPSPSLPLPERVRPITEKQAAEIWEFVDRVKDTVDTLVIHCHQGMSRSPAVAAAVSEYLKLDTNHIYQTYLPNAFVVHTLEEALKTTGRKINEPPELDDEDERILDRL